MQADEHACMGHNEVLIISAKAIATYSAVPERSVQKPQLETTYIICEIGL